LIVEYVLQLSDEQKLAIWMHNPLPEIVLSEMKPNV